MFPPERDLLTVRIRVEPVIRITPPAEVFSIELFPVCSRVATAPEEAWHVSAATSSDTPLTTAPEEISTPAFGAVTATFRIPPPEEASIRASEAFRLKPSTMPPEEARNCTVPPLKIPVQR